MCIAKDGNLRYNGDKILGVIFMLKIEHKKVWWNFFVKNPNVNGNNLKFHFQKSFIVLFVSPPSGQMFSRFILIKYDYKTKHEVFLMIKH